MLIYKSVKHKTKTMKHDYIYRVSTVFVYMYLNTCTHVNMYICKLCTALSLYPEMTLKYASVLVWIVAKLYNHGQIRLFTGSCDICYIALPKNITS